MFYFNTLIFLYLLLPEKQYLYRNFFNVLQGPQFMVPVPIQNTLFFPNLIKKIPNQKINFCRFQQLFNFLSSGCSFFQLKVKNL